MKPLAIATSALFLAACIDTDIKEDPPPTPKPAPTLVPEPSPEVFVPEFDFVNTWPHARTAITGCVNTGRTGKDILGRVGMVSIVSGTITNTEGRSEDYIIAYYASTNQGQGTGIVQVVRVAPGATARWSGTAITVTAYPGKAIECGVFNINAVETNG